MSKSTKVRSARKDFTIGIVSIGMLPCCVKRELFTRRSRGAVMENGGLPATVFGSRQCGLHEQLKESTNFEINRSSFLTFTKLKTGW